MSTITAITAEEILDSRGAPTLFVSVATQDSLGTFAVPSGASTGTHEAHELRDGDPAHFDGKGITKAIRYIETEIAPALVGSDVRDQKHIDSVLIELDGTPNKSRLGGNTLIGVSIAAAKAAGKGDTVSHLRTLADITPSRAEPLLFMNLINGGKHANTRLSFQEYQIIPLVDSATHALEIGTHIQTILGEVIEKNIGVLNGYGDEGGFVVDTEEVTLPLTFLKEAIAQGGYAENITLGLDVAASSLFTDTTYSVGTEHLSPSALLETYAIMQQEFSLHSIEDPFEENDFEHFAQLKSAQPGLLVIGDDLTTTNQARVGRALDAHAIDAVIIKPNQIGTLSETLETMRLTRQRGAECIVSHRSGETNDDFIADLAVAFKCYGLKAGAPRRGERLAKYNRLTHLLTH